jgi:TolB-like protein
MSGLADKLGKAVAAKGCKNVAALDFTDLQGQPTELGRFLSEQLTVEIVATASVSMVDRANIKSILAEHKLTEEGLVNPANAKKLGEFAGVDAILMGNVTVLDDGIVLMVKAISTSSAQIVAAGRITFPKTSEIQQLFNRSVSASAGLTSPPSTTGRDQSATSYQEANAIATKDIGSLRVVLKSVMPLKLQAQFGGTPQLGIRCTFDFISRETQRPIVVAMNAEAGRYKQMGTYMRTALTDERGGTWRVNTLSTKGIGIVSAGMSDWSTSYNPTEVAALMLKRDELNTSINPNDTRLDFILGAGSTIEPGQSISVTLAFVQDSREKTAGPAPKFFQINSEIVVGIMGANAKNSYSLQNLTFDRVSVPAF